MRKKLLLIFLACVAILFVTINIRNMIQRPFHHERVNTVINIAKDTLQSNNQIEIIEIGTGGPVRGGGWGNHIYFKTYLSESESVDFILPPLKSITGNKLIGKISNPEITSYQYGFGKFGGNLLYKGSYDGYWELTIISNP